MNQSQSTARRMNDASIPSRREFLRQSSSALAIGCTLSVCGREVFADAPSDEQAQGGFRQAIATSSRQAGDAARDVLKKGGNAVDAAVAALLVMCVVEPKLVGIGGYGGSFIVYDAHTGRVRAIDSDTRAPRRFDSATFTERTANYGYLAVGVPGVIAGIDLALRELGSRPFKDLAKYSLVLAEKGIKVLASMSHSLQGVAKVMDPVSRNAYFPDGVPAAGGAWVQADLARLIRRLGDEGPASFYSGETAAVIARQIQANGGALAEEDFHAYRATDVEPLHITYRGHDLYTPPPPSGGLTSLSILKTLEQFDLSQIAPWGARFIELFAGASNLAWGERSQYFGDPDFVNVPAEELLSKKWAIARADKLRNGTPTTSPQAKESSHTVNVVVIDKNQNLVSWTATQGGSYGSHVAIEGLGLLLGHGMSKFAFKGPHPNYPFAGKRPQHNMSPLIVLHNGKPYAGLGMPGSKAIVTVTAQMVVNLIDFKATPQKAVSPPRIHTEGSGPIELTDDVPEPVRKELGKRGHKLKIQRFLGDEANIVVVDPATGHVEAAATRNQPGVSMF